MANLRMTRRGAGLLTLAAAAAPRAALAASPADARFAALAALDIDGSARLSPIWATAQGDHRLDAEVDGVSPAARARRARFNRDVLTAAQAIPAAALSREAQ